MPKMTHRHDPGGERAELELKRFQSEIRLNEARIQALKRPRKLQAILILFAVSATTWAFLTTFAGFLADLSAISMRELPLAKERIDSLQDLHAQAVVELERLRDEKRRADSLEESLLQAFATLRRHSLTLSDSALDSIGPASMHSWLGTIFLIEMDSWEGPLLVALQDEETGSGNPSTAGFRFHPESAYGQEAYGNWSSYAKGIVISEHIGGLLVGHHSEIYIDLTSLHAAGGFDARWDSHLGTGSGIARHVGTLAAY